MTQIRTGSRLHRLVAALRDSHARDSAEWRRRMEQETHPRLGGA
jgi:hypothetical protein